MRRTVPTSPDSDLFDLPLLLEPEPSVSPTAEADGPDLAEIEPMAEAEQIELSEIDDRQGAEAVERDPSRDRWIAGALDTALIAIVPLLAVGGATLLGVRPTLGQAPAYVLITLQASFVYLLFCLLFWSRTPGMHRVGLLARAADGGAVTVGQALRRWLGSAVTVALLGLPALPALRGGLSLADRVSGTRLERAA